MGQEKRYRYPGINFFTKDDQDIFCGRADDAQKLFNRVMLNNTMVLHGESGSGKSSLVQAGLLPLLEKQNAHFLSQHKPQYLPITVRLDSISKISAEDNLKEPGGEDALINKIVNAINGCSAYMAKELPFISRKESNFWYTAKLFERNNYTLLLILDQFEELQGYNKVETEGLIKKLSQLFVTPMPEEIYDEYDHTTAELFNAKQMSAEDRKQYNDDIKFIEQPLSVRILFVVREDKLGTMSLLTDYFPSILKNDFFLLPLKENGARSAIEEPAKKEGNFKFEKFSFDGAAVTNLLKNLVDSNGLYDPIQLQIVCSNIERKISVKEKLIKTDNVPSVPDIIRDFYFESWKAIQTEFKLTNDEYDRKRSLIIKDLVVSNSRNLLLEKLLIVDSNKLDESIIKSLVRDGLLRKIPTGDQAYYQLSHDRLMSPLNEDLLELKVKEKEAAEKKQREQDLVTTQKRLRTVYIFLGVAVLALVTAIYFGAAVNKEKVKAMDLQQVADSASKIAKENFLKLEELKKTAIGAAYQGGKVFYWKDTTGEHGLIAAEIDLPGTYTWTQARKTCDDLNLNGYSDWRLPNGNELMSLYSNRTLFSRFNGILYWSSTPDSTFPETIWCKDFTKFNQYKYNYYKSESHSVRAIRDF
jgi:hypothetical protein